MVEEGGRCTVRLIHPPRAGRGIWGWGHGTPTPAASKTRSARVRPSVDWTDTRGLPYAVPEPENMTRCCAAARIVSHGGAPWTWHGGYVPSSSSTSVPATASISAAERLGYGYSRLKRGAAVRGGGGGGCGAARPYWQ